MEFDKTPVDKQRNDKEIKRLVDRLIEAGAFKSEILARPLLEGLQRLVEGQINDAETQAPGTESEVRWLDGEKETRIERLSHCAWQHFNEHFHEKMNIALIELIQESLTFAHPIFLKRSGLSEEEINQASPSRADLEQNVLRWSILRLRNVPYRRRAGNDGAENDATLLPIMRASAEIYNHLGLWTYDHVEVFKSLQSHFLSEIEDASGLNDPAAVKFSHVAARQSADFIWDNIDGAMQTMVSILIQYARLLGMASFEQRHPTIFSLASRLRALPSATTLKDIAAPHLDQWFNTFTVKLRQQGRVPSGTKPSQTEATKLKHRNKVKAAVLTLLNRRAKTINKKSVAAELEITPKTLRLWLVGMGSTLDDLVAEVKRERRI